MKTQPITPGRLPFTREGVSLSPDGGGTVHAAASAVAAADHRFLQANGLPARWAGRQHFVILETGLGIGSNFLATWDAWRCDPQRCEQLVFVSIEKHPLTCEDLVRAHAGAALPALAAQLSAAWPLRTPNLHPLAFENGRVQLLLGFGDVALLLPQLVASVDAFLLDSPATHAAGSDTRFLRRLGRLAAPGATALSWSAPPEMQEGLASAGFQVETVTGPDGSRQTTVARYSPRHRAAPPPGGWHAHRSAREAIVIGAGLAGCAAAWGLSLQGWNCRVLDREREPACATSGNPAGLFHGSFHRGDGPHARAHRAAALLTQRVAGAWISEGRIQGQLAGCLRLESRLGSASARAALAAQQLDSRYVDWLDREPASRLCGLELACGAWHYPGGGWLAPRSYASELLARSGAAFLGNAAVAGIARHGGLWRAMDACGEVLAEAPVLVLANAFDAERLLGSIDDECLSGTRVPAHPGLAAVRGQISSLALADAPSLPMARLPVAGSGYVLPPIDGRLVFGATSQPDDDDPRLRESDHRSNLEQLAGLCAAQAWQWHALPWQGRVGWRTVTPDRLPSIGAAVDHRALTEAARADQPRFVPRLRDECGGLYLFTGLGSRGIAWAALGGQLLASWVSGAPCPVEADLRDALDPARHALRSTADRLTGR